MSRMICRRTSVFWAAVGQRSAGDVVTNAHCPGFGLPLLGTMAPKPARPIGHALKRPQRHQQIAKLHLYDKVKSNPAMLA
jgi:hypothetical protein